MFDQHESSIPLLSPTFRLSKGFGSNDPFLRIALPGIILLMVSGFIFTMSSLYEGLQIVRKLNAASQTTTSGDLHGHSSHVCVPDSKHGKVSIPNTFHHLFDALRHSITAESYTDVQGNIFHTSALGPWWTEPLGNQVLIVDIDTRRPDGKNELWNDGRLDWEHMNTEHGGNGILSASQLNHYLYAQIHGYDYRFFRAHEPEGLHSTWVKPHVLREMLPDYQFVAFLDGDAVVNNLDVSLEWMFNRWGVTNQTSVAVSLDIRQGGTKGSDSRGHAEVNTGFLVVRNSDVTFDLLEAWAGCTTETRYPGCGRWKEEWSHEQRAFSEYIRYDPEFTVHDASIVEVSCDDAMGYPGQGDLDFVRDDCRGNFIRHHTTSKPATIRRAELGILQSVVDLARRDLMRNQRTYVIDEKEREEEQMRIERLRLEQLEKNTTAIATQLT